MLHCTALAFFSLCVNTYSASIEIFFDYSFTWFPDICCVFSTLRRNLKNTSWKSCQGEIWEHNRATDLLLTLPYRLHTHTHTHTHTKTHKRTQTGRQDGRVSTEISWWLYYRESVWAPTGSCCCCEVVHTRLWSTNTHAKRKNTQTL